MKASVVDLGFNSVKLVNYNVSKDNSYNAYEQESAKVKLGESLNTSGYLGRESIQRTIDSLKLFRDIIDFQSIKHVLAVATSAVREAGNKDEFLKKVYEETVIISFVKFKVILSDLVDRAKIPQHYLHVAH